MNIETMTRSQMAIELPKLSDGGLLAQEITQKAGLHCLKHLLNVGVTEENVRTMVAGLDSLAELISAEMRRRGMSTVDHPFGN